LGLIKITSPEGWAPWTYKIYRESAPVNNGLSAHTIAWSDSLAPGKYNVHAENYFGCTAESLAEIPYSCEIADIPTGFSPNGDGKNDILYVRGENIHEMYLTIYNRWGQLVFESRNVNIGWDGLYKGETAPMEAYGYVLSVVFKSGRTFYKKGNVTLIR
jgi:gliding motility-associated-like protein